MSKETSPYFLLAAQDQRLDAEREQLCRSTRTSSGNSQETETCMVWACHTPQQPVQNHPSGHLGGWTTRWSAEELLNGQYQRVDILAHARTAYTDLMRKRLRENLCRIVPHVPPTTQSDKGLNWTDTILNLLLVTSSVNKTTWHIFVYITDLGPKWRSVLLSF